MSNPIFMSVALLIVGTTVATADDFQTSQSRPLMAISGQLCNRYGLLITYEDAPTDLVTETEGEVRPSGLTFLFPKWKPITFHVSSSLPIRSDVTQPIGRVVDPDESYAAVQDIVSQYNESGNPGRFTVVQDHQYTHIQQTLRKVNGSLQPFEPFSNTVLKWQWKSGSCHQVLSALINALAQQHEIGIAQGNLPVGSLYMHHCDIEGSSASVRQVLEALVDGLDANITGEKMGFSTWNLVYDPNWNKYFLNLYWVRQIESSQTPESPQSQHSPTSNQTQPGGTNQQHGQLE